MAVTLIDTAGAPRPWKRTTFRELGHDESFLEKLVANDPTLLGLDPYETGVSGRFVARRQRGLATPTGRRVKPDVVILTDGGHIVVVEVKLADNPELRDRGVVAQVVEYAASIANLDEEAALDWLGGDGDESWAEMIARIFPGVPAPERLAKALLGRMRDARIHLVIVSDGTPAGLEELVRGVAGQATLGDFQLHVVELVPHVCDGIEGILLLPNTRAKTEIIARTAVTVSYRAADEKPVATVVASSVEQVEEAIAAAKSRKTVRPEFVAAIDAYDAVAPEELRSDGRDRSFRVVAPNGWPRQLHYEFLDGSGGEDRIGVELHLENRSLKALGPELKSLASKVAAQFPEVGFDPLWARGLGRLHVRLPQGEPEKIAATMVRFIEVTKPAIDAALARLSTPSGEQSSP